MSRLFVPMTKATGLGPLPDLLEQSAGSHAVAAAFQQTNLPLEILEFRDTRIPVEAMRDLFERSARAAGDRCFGLSVGQDMTHTNFGIWMHYCAQAPNLAEGLRRVVACAGFQQTGGYLTFDPNAPMSFWHYIAPPGLVARPIHHADHLIGPMIRFVRAYLGPDWQPEWVEVNYPRDPQAHQMEQQLGLPVRYGAKGVGLAIRHEDLQRSTTATPNARRTLTFSDVHASEFEPPFQEPLASAFSAICLRLLEGHTDIDGAARTLGVGVQKLQRGLRREGLDYRTLLDMAKRLRAQSLLLETTLPITEIALALGYSDHGNFSRAFKRLVGVAPVAFRNIQSKARIQPTPAAF